MKEEINIADILRNEPAGTLLYSPVCGAVEIPTRDYFNRHFFALKKEIFGQIEKKFCARNLF